MHGLYVSAAGAHVQSKRMEVISNNLANVDTVGFRRDVAVAKARATEAIERGIVSPGSEGPNDVGGGVQLIETLTDQNAGKYADTGNPTDLAIVDGGESFFVVEKDDKRFLTRAGNFNFDADGFLVALSDYPEPVGVSFWERNTYDIDEIFDDWSKDHAADAEQYGYKEGGQ